jgi:hypothetical protein
MSTKSTKATKIRVDMSGRIINPEAIKRPRPGDFNSAGHAISLLNGGAVMVPIPLSVYRAATGLALLDEMTPDAWIVDELLSGICATMDFKEGEFQTLRSQLATATRSRGKGGSR